MVLVIMDGVGVGAGDPGDAVAAARTPTLDRLQREGAWRTLRAHGTAVGLPSDDDMGNSEVGHNALGAGRVIDQGARLVERALRDGSIFEAPAWQTLRDRCLAGGTLHLIGLLSDGNVHSHERHLHGLIRQAAADGFQRVRVHALLDGRDVGATTALTYVDRLEAVLADAGDGRDYRIGSGGGRMLTTMDRYEADWRIVERGWNAHVHGNAAGFSSARGAIEAARAAEPGLGDQYLPAFAVVDDDGRPVGAMADGDAVVFFNFRGDRALEISRAFDGGADFDAFDRGTVPDVFFAGMTLYDGDLGIPDHHLVPPPKIERPLSQRLSASGVRQFAVAETQKFGHVTYFWNGNRGQPFDAAFEEEVEVPSDRVRFEERPWMKAAEVTDAAIEAIRRGDHPFVRLNYANGDMVGHSGHVEATILSIEAMDLCLERLAAAVARADGTLVVTADHGNADQKYELDAKGAPKLGADGLPKIRTSHSLNPVPFIIHRAGAAAPALRLDLPEAGLAHVAATLAELLGFAPPADMEPSLLA